MPWLIEVFARQFGAWIGLCVFRKSVTGLFGIVTDDFGNVTGHFGDVTEGSTSVF